MKAGLLTADESRSLTATLADFEARKGAVSWQWSSSQRRNRKILRNTAFGSPMLGS
jgi:hypothetical protein